MSKKKNYKSSLEGVITKLQMECDNRMRTTDYHYKNGNLQLNYSYLLISDWSNLLEILKSCTKSSHNR